MPDLGLRRGLGRDLVIAPYATALALAVRPKQALRNLRELAGMGLVGRYGFFEAADFTADRQSEGGRFVPVRTYMAHHQGMSLAAIGNVLCEDMFVRWFHADPHVRTIDLLLNERIPWELPPEIARMEIRETPKLPESAIPPLHGWTPVVTDTGPSYHTIGNGRLSTLFRGDGGGGLLRNGVALTRFAPADREAGYWLYLRDLEAGQLWSITEGPVPGGGEGRLTYNAHQIEYHRELGNIAATMVVSLAQGDDVEIRHLTLVNNSDRVRTLDVTSYAEVVLAPPMDAARHPAFSKLFVSSEPLPNLDGILFTRRPRGPSDVAPVLLHRLVAEPRAGASAIETDRRAFLGRHGSHGRPEALSRASLSGTTGWTLDPVLALQSRFSIPAGGRHELAFVTVAAGSRERAIEIAERYATFAALDWATRDAATAAARAVYTIGLRPEQLPLAQRLLSQLYLPALPSGDLSLASPGSRADLWSLGISGDDPLIMLRMGEGDPTGLFRFLLAAQALWRRMGIRVDLAVCYEGEPGYVEPVREALLDVLQEAGAREQIGLRGGVHLINVGRAEASKGAFLERAARLVLHAAGPDLEEQLRALAEWHSISPRFAPVEGHAAIEEAGPLERPPLLFDNGLGGFTPEDGAYVMHLDPGRRTPAPWANVLANATFGTIVTEAGLGFSWAVNGGENRLTPWLNDPVRDIAPEQLFLRDEESAAIWSVTPRGADHDVPCRIDHGVGYSTWQRNSHGLEQHLRVFVPLDEPVKLVRLHLRNVTDRPRRITATYYAEWLLGAVAGEPAPLRTSVYDPASHALMARNPWSEEFREAVAFLTSSMAPHSVTTSRRAFLGREADRSRPEGLLNWDLG
ncbi:MAG: cellobiose phosphorylase, partial [Sphingomonadales bacterium]|nr:cellobiose phosphorylase [Sphingomonadales bacterium]